MTVPLAQMYIQADEASTAKCMWAIGHCIVTLAVGRELWASTTGLAGFASPEEQKRKRAAL